jgi:anti-sigma factor RsiW
MSSRAERERFRRDHRWAPDRMSDYLDGNLAANGRARMERHLSECEKCRRLLAGLRRTVDLLHRHVGPSGGADPLKIAASVRASIERG